MAEFSSTVVAPVRVYHVYMDQWEAEIDTTLFFVCELGQYDIIEGIYCFLASIRSLFAELVTLSLSIATASATC